MPIFETPKHREVEAAQLARWCAATGMTVSKSPLRSEVDCDLYMNGVWVGGLEAKDRRGEDEDTNHDTHYNLILQEHKWDAGMRYVRRGGIFVALYQFMDGDWFCLADEHKNEVGDRVKGFTLRNPREVNDVDDPVFLIKRSWLLPILGAKKVLEDALAHAKLVL